MAHLASKDSIPEAYTVVVDAGDEYEQAHESVYIESDASNPRLGVVLPPVSRLYTVDISLRPKMDTHDPRQA
jgi:hypothetical protein